jgi:flagellar hook protein FlgE
MTPADLGYPGRSRHGLSTSNFSGSTQFGSSFAVNAMLQDGYASGTLAGFNIGKRRCRAGRYTNGQSQGGGPGRARDLPQSAGPAAAGRQRLGAIARPAARRSWVRRVIRPVGVLQSAALEDSNVDLTAELVSMITQQRAYQANAQTIKTQDSILQTW